MTADGLPGDTTRPSDTWLYETTDRPKTLRETLCIAQARISNSPFDRHRTASDLAVLQRLIDACDRMRPLGPDGKHDGRHTAACGCDPSEKASDR